MDASKYTPGPWRVALDGRYIMDGDTYIAEVLQRGISGEEMAANAALLAAAPEMVEALHTVILITNNEGVRTVCRNALAKTEAQS